MDSEQRNVERSVLIVGAVTSFMAPFMISAVNVALPAIQHEFSAGAVALSWVATAYLLATAVFLVPIGRIADIYGRKKIFSTGILVFTIASFFTILANSVPLLIFFRVFQGFGSAMLVTTGMAIITSVFPPQKRGKALGIMVSSVYVGLSMGPFMGGIMTQHLGWRSLFILVTPIGIISFLITLRYLKGEWADARGEPFDAIGSLLYGAALVLLIYGSTFLPRLHAVYLMTPGIACLIAFIKRELSFSAPVFEVRLFAENKLFTFSSLAALINYSATFGITFLLSLYLQYIKGMSPQVAGTLLVVQPVCQALGSPIAGRLSDRIEPRRLASFGMAQTALGLFLIRIINAQTPIGYIAAVLIVLGLGFALFSSPNMNAIMGSVTKRYYGIAAGAAATMRLLGQMLSMAIITVVFALLIGQIEITPERYDLLLKSMRISLLISALMCCVGIFFSLFRGNVRD